MIDFVLGNISPIDFIKNNYFEQSLIIPPLNVFSMFMFRSQPTLFRLSQHEEVTSPTPYDSASEEVDDEFMDEPYVAYFKVLGTRFQSSMENYLEEAHNYWVTSHNSVEVRLQPENEKDKDAILRHFDYSTGFKCKRCLHLYVKNLNVNVKNALINVKVEHISFSLVSLVIIWHCQYPKRGNGVTRHGKSTH